MMQTITYFPLEYYGTTMVAEKITSHQSKSEFVWYIMVAEKITSHSVLENNKSELFCL
jgi:hypothetical protein